MANRHTGTWPGKRVRIKLRDGRVIIRRFLRNDSGVAILGNDETGHIERINQDRILSLCIHKPRKGADSSQNNVPEKT